MLGAPSANNVDFQNVTGLNNSYAQGLNAANVNVSNMLSFDTAMAPPPSIHQFLDEASKEMDEASKENPKPWDHMDHMGHMRTRTHSSRNSSEVDDTTDTPTPTPIRQPQQHHGRAPGRQGRSRKIDYDVERARQMHNTLMQDLDNAQNQQETPLVHLR